MLIDIEDGTEVPGVDDGEAGSAVARALRAAWSGADPGAATRPRPAAGRRWSGPRVLLRRGEPSGIGALLDLALAGDPERVQGGVRLRRVPSAGGRYPVEAHVVADGRAWRYDPVDHALAVPVDGGGGGAPGSGGGVPPPGGGGTTVVLSLVPQRTVWRYGKRSLPVLLLDLGHAIGALLAAAPVAGYAARAEIGRPARGLAAEAALPWRDGAVRWPGAAPEYPLAAVRLDPVRSRPAFPDRSGAPVHHADPSGVPARAAYPSGSPVRPRYEHPGGADAPGSAPIPGAGGAGPGSEPALHASLADAVRVVEDALAELGEGAPEGVDFAAPAQAPPVAAVLERCSSPWEEITAAAGASGRGGPPVERAPAPGSVPGGPRPPSADRPGPPSPPAPPEQERSPGAPPEQSRSSGSPSGGPVDPADAARARIGADRVVAVRPAGVPGLGEALAPRSCGQPVVAEAAHLLLLLGAPESEPDPWRALAEHVGAGIAAHEAWLWATGQGRAVRPAGCWIDAVLAAGERRGRLIHSLAIGDIDIHQGL
ncbi:hypothetical protein ACFOVU_11645 [Nocardiopsis sediminis]|uniref:Uncharacterized protein n=1 Tax=Nocardiopsis sediminis TaxID=1778267 RepID=A0ABV8FPF9_9ACTN